MRKDFTLRQLQVNRALPPHDPWDHLVTIVSTIEVRVGESRGA